VAKQITNIRISVSTG